MTAADRPRPVARECSRPRRHRRPRKAPTHAAPSPDAHTAAWFAVHPLGTPPEFEWGVVLDSPGNDTGVAVRYSLRYGKLYCLWKGAFPYSLPGLGRVTGSGALHILSAIDTVTKNVTWVSAIYTNSSGDDLSCTDFTLYDETLAVVCTVPTRTAIIVAPIGHAYSSTRVYAAAGPTGPMSFVVSFSARDGGTGFFAWLVPNVGQSFTAVTVDYDVASNALAVSGNVNGSFGGIGPSSGVGMASCIVDGQIGYLHRCMMADSTGYDIVTASAALSSGGVLVAGQFSGPVLKLDSQTALHHMPTANSAGNGSILAMQSSWCRTPTATRPSSHTTSPSFTSTVSEISTRTASSSTTRTPSPWSTASSSTTRTPSPWSTASNTQSVTSTLTPIPTHTSTVSPANTPTVTFTPFRTVTRTSTVSWTPATTVTDSATFTLTPSETFSPLPTNTSTLTITPDATKTVPPTWTPEYTDTITASPTVAKTVTVPPTRTGDRTPTRTPTVTVTPIPTRTPNRTTTHTDSPSVTPVSSASPSLNVTDTASRTTSSSPSVTFTPFPTRTRTTMDFFLVNPSLPGVGPWGPTIDTPSRLPLFFFGQQFLPPEVVRPKVLPVAHQLAIPWGIPSTVAGLSLPSAQVINPVVPLSPSAGPAVVTPPSQLVPLWNSVGSDISQPLLRLALPSEIPKVVSFANPVAYKSQLPPPDVAEANLVPLINSVAVWNEEPMVAAMYLHPSFVAFPTLLMHTIDVSYPRVLQPASVPSSFPEITSSSLGTISPHMTPFTLFRNSLSSSLGSPLVASTITFPFGPPSIPAFIEQRIPVPSQPATFPTVFPSLGNVALDPSNAPSVIPTSAYAYLGSKYPELRYKNVVSLHLSNTYTWKGAEALNARLKQSNVTDLVDPEQIMMKYLVNGTVSNSSAKHILRLILHITSSPSSVDYEEYEIDTVPVFGSHFELIFPINASSFPIYEGSTIRAMLYSTDAALVASAHADLGLQVYENWLLWRQDGGATLWSELILGISLLLFAVNFIYFLLTWDVVGVVALNFGLLGTTLCDLFDIESHPLLALRKLGIPFRQIYYSDSEFMDMFCINCLVLFALCLTIVVIFDFIYMYVLKARARLQWQAPFFSLGFIGSNLPLLCFFCSIGFSRLPLNTSKHGREDTIAGAAFALIICAYLALTLWRTYKCFQASVSCGKPNMPDGTEAPPTKKITSDCAFAWNNTFKPQDMQYVVLSCFQSLWRIGSTRRFFGTRFGRWVSVYRVHEGHDAEMDPAQYFDQGQRPLAKSTLTVQRFAPLFYSFTPNCWWYVAVEPLCFAILYISLGTGQCKVAFVIAAFAMLIPVMIQFTIVLPRVHSNVPPLLVMFVTTVLIMMMGLVHGSSSDSLSQFKDASIVICIVVAPVATFFQLLCVILVNALLPHDFPVGESETPLGMWPECPWAAVFPTNSYPTSQQNEGDPEMAMSDSFAFDSTNAGVKSLSFNQSAVDLSRQNNDYFQLPAAVHGTYGAPPTVSESEPTAPLHAPPSYNLPQEPVASQAASKVVRESNSPTPFRHRPAPAPVFEVNDTPQLVEEHLVPSIVAELPRSPNPSQNTVFGLSKTQPHGSSPYGLPMSPATEAKLYALGMQQRLVTFSRVESAGSPPSIIHALRALPSD